MDLARVEKNSLRAWTLAVRPKTLSAGIVPIAVGTLLSDNKLVSIDWVVAFFALLCSMAIQIATNLINDALDFKKGSDTKERIGPIRVTQTGLLTEREVLLGGFGFLVLAFILGLPLIFKGGQIFIVLLIASSLCSYLYTGGPYPLAYVGLGELFVILFYGIFATTAAFYLQAGEVSFSVFLASIEMGFLSSVLLAVNNLRDVNEDAKSNKKTLAVRLGVDIARREIAFLVLAPFVLNIFWLFTPHPLAFLLPITALPIGINLIRGVFQHAPSKIYNRFLGESSLLIMLYGILLILGYRLAS